MPAIIFLAKLDFWCHVCLGASLRLEKTTFLLAGEPEVSQFNRHIICEENVLKLNVSVYKLTIVHMVKNVNHLVQKEAANILTLSTIYFA